MLRLLRKTKLKVNLLPTPTIVKANHAMPWLAFLLFLSSVLPSKAQNCTDGCEVRQCSGEILEYDLVYHWGFISTVAGHVTFSVGDTVVNGSTHPCYRGFGWSEPSWNWFYEVNSTYVSYTDSTLFPLFFSRKGIEGSEIYDREYYVSGNTATVNDRDEDGQLERKQLELLPCSFDVISAVYYCRAIDFKAMNTGETIPLNLFLDGETYTSYVRYIGIQNWVHPETGITHECIVFKPWLIDGTVFSEGENMTVFVSNTPDKIPLYIETDLLVGKAEVYFVPEKSTLVTGK
ncbi:MAG: DUF3108 domain-containing protein [Flavobacteriales bacterium]|nr:DUF3108 domain-containing protein [Flavobacteriales bacterium]